MTKDQTNHQADHQTGQQTDDNPDNIPMPPLITGDIDAATLEQYFSDLAHYAQVDHLRCKFQRHRLANQQSGGQLTLKQAQAAISSDQASGMQVSYRYDNEAWRDTLMLRGPGHWHLVRLREADLAAG